MIVNAIIFHMLEEIVRENLIQMCRYEPNERLVLGFSGGADSSCLLDIFHWLKIETVVAYFNHKLRPEADEEILLARKSADRYGFLFRGGEADVRKAANMGKMGIEETARNYRYQFLVNTALETKAAAIAVAHHADDQVETILLNLIRGTGLKGLKGMDMFFLGEFHDRIPIIRPLLTVWKDDIIKYCAEKNLQYVHDETNTDTKYTRNNVRAHVIPQLEEINPNFKANILQLSAIAGEDLLVLQHIANELWDQIIICDKQDLIKVNLSKFRNQKTSMQRLLIKRILEEKFGLMKDLTFNMVESARNVLNGRIESNYSQLNTDVEVHLEEENGLLYRSVDDLNENEIMLLTQPETNLNIPSITNLNSKAVIECKLLLIEDVLNDYQSNQDKNTAFLDAAAIKKPIVMRRWREGDRYAPLGLSGHTMKVSDFWINKRLPRRLRNAWPIICTADQIIWIPGFQSAYQGRITKATVDVLKMRVYSPE